MFQRIIFCHWQTIFKCVNAHFADVCSLLQFLQHLKPIALIDECRLYFLLSVAYFPSFCFCITCHFYLFLIMSIINFSLSVLLYYNVSCCLLSSIGLRLSTSLHFLSSYALFLVSLLLINYYSIIVFILSLIFLVNRYS